MSFPADFALASSYQFSSFISPESEPSRINGKVLYGPDVLPVNSVTALKESENLKFKIKVLNQSLNYTASHV